MRLIVVLFILTSIEAKRRRFRWDEVNIHRQNKTSDVDVYPDKFEHPVDFGHVYRDEYRKELTNVEPDMVQPQSIEHARQLLRKVGSGIVDMKKPEEPMGFSNSRDALLYYERQKSLNSDMDIGQRINRPPRIKNTTQAIRKSAEEEIKRKYPSYRPNNQERSPSDGFQIAIPKDSDDHKEKFFSKSGFNLVSDESYDVGNWTTCKEFAKGAVFHPDDVINIPWVPFFIWSPRRFLTAVVHTLTYPTKKLVKQYKEKFGPYLNIKVDWEQPKLILKESTDMLLVAGDRKGLFYGIPHIELPSPKTNFNIKLPVAMVRFKIIDPYLAMMYCNENYAAIMSVLGSEPETDTDKTAEAALLKFQGIGNPASRDLELEGHKSKYEIERKRREDESKYINVERPDDRLDPSLW